MQKSVIFIPVLSAICSTVLPMEMLPANVKTVVTQEQKKILVKGKVVDATGEPLIGAAVVQVGATSGVVTDVDGLFEFNVDKGATLEVSYLGYNSVKVPAQTGKPLIVTLNESVFLTDEVVVVGYGTAKKATLTGSVTAVTTEELTKAPVTNISNAIVGKLPGVQVFNPTGMPGSTSEVNIRGFGNALVVVDGVEQPGFQIDPNEIETFTVLKDASAAVYGVRAANGVILITTKKGSQGKSSISYNGSVGIQNQTQYPRMVNAYEYALLTDEDAYNRGLAPVYGPEKIEKYRLGEEGYKSYDWQDILIRKNAPQTMHNVNVNGGTDKVSYFASLGYTFQEGLYRSGGLNYDRYNFRSNVSAQVLESLKAEIGVSARLETFNKPSVDDTYVTHAVTRQHPFYSPWANDDEGIHYGVTNHQNPLAASNPDYAGYKKERKKHANITTALTYEAPFAPGLKAKVFYSHISENAWIKNFDKRWELYRYDRENDVYNVGTVYNNPSKLTRQDNFYEQNLLQAQINYDKTIKEHNFSVMGVYEQRYDYGDYLNGFREFNIDVLDQLGAGRDMNKNNAGYENELAYASFIGRVNYNYAEKYMFEFAFREDGSSKFYRNERWGFFPSVLLAWRMSEERFMKSLSWIDNMKLRFSYGVMGDDSNAGKFQYLPGYTYPSGGNFIFGDGVTSGLTSKGLVNRDLTWMTSKTSNIGIDATLLNNKLQATIDLFYRKRSGLLATRVVSLPNTFGASLPQENLNSDSHRGFEIALTHNNRINEFQYSLTGNVSYSRAKNNYIERAPSINSFNNYQNNATNRWKSRSYGLKWLGYFESQEEINNWAIQDGAGNKTLSIGDLKYQDTNSDGIIDGLDNVTIGKGSRPELYFAIEGSMNWKGLDFNMLWQGAGSYCTYMSGLFSAPFFNGSNSPAEFLDRWRRADPTDPNSEWISGKYPATYINGKENNKYLSSFNTIKGRYIRLKNLELGYTLPVRYTAKAGISKLRFYVSGNNLLTFANLPWGDPEAPTSDRILYPQLRIWNFGVNINF